MSQYEENFFISADPVEPTFSSGKKCKVGGVPRNPMDVGNGKEVKVEITEAGRELADPAGVAALAIRRMSPFWFFLELWDLWSTGTGSGPGGGGQTSLKLMDGRSLVPLRQACTHVTFGLTLAPFWGSGLGLISGPFGRRFQDSFWSSLGAPKVSRNGARRQTESQKILRPNLESFRCTLLR